ncbi:HPr family phosphocarrier protein [Paenibacillus wulumuqiensis]|uniref:HPr family phosphocarrier protein n=1 Tax=Paenibacillus wulumuqiensis TaxID=1567107 RepID=UPI0006199217|nr:HPr family phosphocarrier protein [Paenibacillus wulumuqiensis]
MRVHQFTVQSNLDRAHLLRIANEASRFASDIRVSFGPDSHRREVDVKSLLGMMLTIISANTEICLTTRGKDELEALEYVQSLFEQPIIAPSM